MNESKIDVTDRLRREGRWAEASKFKDAVVKELRAQGMKKIEAVEEAWRRMAEQFPSLKPDSDPRPGPGVDGGHPTGPQGEPPGDGGDDEGVLLDPAEERESPDLVRDTLWAYENLENRQAKPDQAPGPGAWSLLRWAREYRSRFFEVFLPKALAAKGRKEDDERKIPEEERSIEAIREVLQTLLKDADRQPAEENLIGRLG